MDAPKAHLRSKMVSMRLSAREREMCEDAKQRLNAHAPNGKGNGWTMPDLLMLGCRLANKLTRGEHPSLADCVKEA